MSTRPWEEGVMHAGSNQNAPSMYIIILAMPMGDLLVCKPPANIAAFVKIGENNNIINYYFY